MRQFGILVVAIGGVALVVAVEQRRTATAADWAISGELVRCQVSSRRLTLLIEGDERSFVVADDAVVHEGTRTAALADVCAVIGHRIRVWYRESGGTQTVHDIRMSRRAMASRHARTGTSLATSSECRRQCKEEVVMPLSLKRSFVLAALFMGAAAGGAYARDVISVKVPFDFQVKGQTFHAGTYELGMNPADGGVISLRGDHGKAFAFVSTIPASGHDPEGDRPTLVFSRGETRYVLSQVWENGTQGREIAKG